MTASQLIKELGEMPDQEITVRCSYDGDAGPNGPCFRIDQVSFADDHSTGERVVIIDCNQETCDDPESSEAQVGAMLALRDFGLVDFD